MKKLLILTIGLVLGLASISYACHGEGKMDMDKDMAMGGMHCMMDKASIVSSSDGGVIVLKGNTLYKYDKNLKLIKEVELASCEGKKSMGMCPMMKKGDMMKDAAEKQTAPEPVSDAAAHEAHH